MTAAFSFKSLTEGYQRTAKSEMNAKYKDSLLTDVAQETFSAPARSPFRVCKNFGDGSHSVGRSSRGDDGRDLPPA